MSPCAIHKVVFIFFIFIFNACDSKKPNTESEDVSGNKPPPTVLSDTAVEKLIKDKAYYILKLIKEKNFAALSSQVHPKNGLRLTPYAYVSPEQDLSFTPREVKDLAMADAVYTWGFYDGSGKPIKATFEEYYQEFIYNADFINAEVHYNNDQQRGNAINNSRDVYGIEAEIVEFYIPGQEEKFGGMDWKSLRLVFTPYNNKWYLEGIIHAQWTI